MKIFTKIGAAVFAVAFALGVVGPVTALAATSPALGAADALGILSGTFTRNIAVTAITGGLGYTTPSGSGSHTVTGSTFICGGAGNATYVQAGIDANTALTALNSVVTNPCTFTFAAGAINLATDITHGPIGVYTPGVYCVNGAATIGTGGITLNGAGTYIFRIVGALNSVDNSIVTLANGASSCDVFWAPTAATTLGANTTFVGTVIDNANAITVGNTTAWIGRALSLGAGTVTTDTDTITTACTVAPLTPVPAVAGAGVGNYWAPLPLINITKIPNPLALPAGAGSVTYTYTVTNIGPVAMRGVWVKDDKCSAVNFVSGDTNSDSLLDLTETWIYRCTKTVSATETNVATTHGQANGWDVYDNAQSTVVVGSPLTPPIIHLVKRPNTFILPVGGGAVTYSYSVTNPGTAPLSNVTITDNKCTGLPGRVVGHPGDLNKNNLLESNETWTFTCQTSMTQTTTNIGTAIGFANGLSAVDISPATVVVTSPGLPQTGYEEDAAVKTIKSSLFKGNRSSDVAILQKFLVAQNKGPAAQALAVDAPTTYFGALTRAALAEFQAAVGITPAVGNFGSKTRAYISANY